MILEPGKTYIGKLRATCRVRDAFAVRMRLDGMLSATDLWPTGLPASAIVFIRKLHDPLPGVFQLQQGNVRPPLAWERALAASLEQLVRRAARPALGAVPADAEAVIFSDRAELLACLASDWCAGSGVTHWWWQSLGRGVDIAQTVLHAWMDAPEYVPAALQQMARSRQAVPFVRVLSINDAHSLLLRITQSFALHGLQSAIDTELAENSRPTSGEVKALKAGETARPLHSPSSVLSAAQHAPWQRWVPESEDSGLPLEHQCLLGIGLMLQRAPGAVRSHAFALAARAWLRTAMVSDGTVATPAIDPTTDRRDLPMANTDLMAHIDEAGRSLAKGEDRLAGTDMPHQAQTPLLSAPALSQQPSGATAVAVMAQEHTHIERVEPLTAPSQTTPLVEQTPEAASLPDAVIDTGLGGLFYLINLGLFLDLYSDFTTPAQQGLALPLWDFVALLGQQLVGDRLQDDPIWSLLARLAGRSEDEEPGLDFDPPESWRVSAAWLAPFSHKGIWEWETFAGRLRVRHPEKFLVLDVALDDGDPTQQLLRETHPYDSGVNFEWRRGSSASAVAGRSPLQHWIGWLIPYVRARLHRALGLIEADDLPHVLCEHHARVFVTATHLELFFALDALPIEIRLAGLDRNPGWVPAAGRFIAFHFE